MEEEAEHDRRLPLENGIEGNALRFQVIVERGMHHAVLAFLIHEVLDLRAQLRIGDVIAIITHAGDEELLALREQQRHRIEEAGLERIVVEPPTRHVLPRERGALARNNCLRTATIHRSEEHTSELQSLMRISYAVFCLKKKKHKK